jgi:hypothetical protein
LKIHIFIKDQNKCFSIFLGVKCMQCLRNNFCLRSHRGLLNDEEFKNAIYTIDMGQNDIAGSFIYFSYPQAIKRIPSFITEIKNSIWVSFHISYKDNFLLCQLFVTLFENLKPCTLFSIQIYSIYQHGGKNFWVHNTGPLGYLPQQLATTGTGAIDFDQYGCLISLNKAAKAFNKQLHALCEELRSEMKNAMIVYLDIYAMKYDLISNFADYIWYDLIANFAIHYMNSKFHVLILINGLFCRL